MTKREFLSELRAALAWLPREDIEERTAFYTEMIDDRIEEGLSESEAVAEVGSVDEIAEQTLAEIPLSKLVKQRMTPKRSLRGWEKALIVLGFPVWFPLLTASAALLLALLVCVFALIIALWAVELALWAAAAGCIVLSVISFSRGQMMPGVAALGAALVSAGLALLAYYGCVAATRGLLRLTKTAALRIKSLFAGKESKE